MENHLYQKIKRKIIYWILEIKRQVIFLFFGIKGKAVYYSIKYNLINKKINKINLCSGPVIINGYYNIDFSTNADLFLDLEKKLLPFSNNSIDVVVCISAINYFDRSRGAKIIKDIHRVLKPGGIARFGTQDLKLIAKKYINDDKEFFFQKLPNGQERFKGKTMCDKINSWFYGYRIAKNKHGKYFYDYETLAQLFTEAGFSLVEKRNYLDSRLGQIELIDNRPEQMFFLEAIK